MSNGLKFDIHAQDFGRLGQVSADGKLRTPNIFGALKKITIVRESGPIFRHKSIEDYMKSAGGNDLAEVPYFPFPYDFPNENAEEFAERNMEIGRKFEGIDAGLMFNLVLSKHENLTKKQLKALPKNTRVLKLQNSERLMSDQRSLVNIFMHLREYLDPNVLICWPRICSPEFIPLLVYLGVDLFCGADAALDAAYGTYWTDSGRLDSERMDEVREQDISKNNNAVLENVLWETREKIREGRFREYVESKCALEPNAMSALRISDDMGFLERFAPTERRAEMKFTTELGLTRPEVLRWQGKISGEYKRPEQAKVLVLLPCASRKPYSCSRSHMKFAEAIREGEGKKWGLVHEVIITSPLGIVPRELENTYPANAYDTSTTGKWSAEEVKVLGDLLKEFLKKNKYKKMIAHVSGGYKEVCERAGVNNFTAGENGTSDGSLKKLRIGLKKALAGIKCNEGDNGNRNGENLRNVIEFQMGKGALKAFPKDITLKKGEVMSGKDMLGDFDEHGCFRLALDGAGKLGKLKGRAVVFGDEKMSGSSLLCPGVSKADKEIRAGDEVVVYSKSGRLIGTGKAKIDGITMDRMRRGIAVKLRENT